jgi:hypothetical protein
VIPGDPYDPFGGPTAASVNYSSGFGAEEAFGSGNFMPAGQAGFARNDFGQGSMADNPFMVKPCFKNDTACLV